MIDTPTRRRRRPNLFTLEAHDNRQRSEDEQIAGSARRLRRAELRARIRAWLR